MLSRLNGGLITTANRRVSLGLPSLSAFVGQHIGHFYRTKEEAKHLLVSFLKTGLLQGDPCVCHLGPHMRMVELQEALAAASLDVDQALYSGRLFLEEGPISAQLMVGKYRHASEAAGESGQVFRWVGDITECVTLENAGEKFLEAEETFAVIKHLNGVVLCQYDLNQLSAGVLMDAQNRHPVWIINSLMHNNPFYENGNPIMRRPWFDERYQILMDINQAITRVSDRSSLLEGIARILERVLKFDRADLALLDHSGEVLRIYDIVENPGMKGQVPIGTEFFVRDSTLQAEVIRENKPYIFRDLGTEIRGAMGDRILQEGIRSGILVPLTRNGKTLGTLNLGSRRPHQYSEKDAELLMEVSRQLALPIENLLAREEIDRLKFRFEEESLFISESARSDHKFKNIVGQSLAIRKVLKAVETVAPTDAGILLSGETGTGKELIVHAIHNLSLRAERPLIKVNCAALPAGLIESELFGHEKGAYTGALSRKIGRFEMADGGTIFLDEIGDLHLELQAKLLRVLQEGEFERVGGHHTFRVDVRVIAATNTDLEMAVQMGKFRPDLFYRLNVFPIVIPPLRERKDDIPLLVKYFVMRYGAKLRKNIERIPQTTMDSLLAYSWPGNIRELENLIERAVILSEGVQLEAGKWLPQQGSGPSESRISTMDELERQHIVEVLDHTGWRVSGEKGAAKLLGMKPTTLEARMKKLGIKRK